MTSNDTHVLLGIEAKDRDRAVVDSHTDDAHPDAAHPDAALHRDRRHPSCPIADLDENQHALAFEMRDVVSPGANSC